MSSFESYSGLSNGITPLVNYSFDTGRDSASRLAEHPEDILLPTTVISLVAFKRVLFPLANLVSSYPCELVLVNDFPHKPKALALGY